MTALQLPYAATAAEASLRTQCACGSQPSPVDADRAPVACSPAVGPSPKCAADDRMRAHPHAPVAERGLLPLLFSPVYYY